VPNSKIDLDTQITSLAGEPHTLRAHEGKVMLIVNTASKCGFTPQLEGLQKLSEEYADQGLVVLGFPCNQFGKQEPGSADAIESFCQINYGVTFPMHAKIEVNGDAAHPLFAQLKSAAPGLLGSKSIKWNFTKFLVGRDGTVESRHGPNTEPAMLRGEIEALLNRGRGG
jgi:glutathione peroxidase